MTTHTSTFTEASIGPERKAVRVRAEKSSRGNPGPPLAGMLWFGGWLFSIGFLKLVWWKALLGLVVWPYFLGLAAR